MSDSSEQGSPADVRLEKETMENQVICQARAQLSKSDHFRRRCDSIGIEYQQGQLVLMGRLPSFYLKQVLQTVLRGLPGVQRIDNRVDVISVTGLSSAKGNTSRKQPA